MEIDYYTLAAERAAVALADALRSVVYEHNALVIAAQYVLGAHHDTECHRIVADLLASRDSSEPLRRAQVASFLLRHSSFHGAFQGLYHQARWYPSFSQHTTSAEVIQDAIGQYPRVAGQIAAALAASLLAGPFERHEWRRRTEALLGPLTRKDQRRLVGQLLQNCRTIYPPSAERLKQQLLGRRLFHYAMERVRLAPDLIHPVLDPPRFTPIARFAGLEIPRIATTGDLARWLGLTLSELDWFSDERRQHKSASGLDLQHYSYAFIPKRSGPPRLVEQPKRRLKAIQRRLLDEIVSKVPVHDAAFGFVEGRSAIDGAARHVGEEVVITCDIESFFSAVPSRRIHALFRSLGYPSGVARALTGLVTTTTPTKVLDRSNGRDRLPNSVRLYLQRQHLAQGAPSSPAIANLCAWRFDLRLAGLANRFDARYTRYADDMTFSGGGDLQEQAHSLLRAVRDIAVDEGFRLNPAKSRIATRDRRQIVTGIVVNDRMNTTREEYDLLKATLFNAGRNGWQSENRQQHPAFRAHLEGRISWVERLNPRRGAKLRALFDQIKW